MFPIVRAKVIYENMLINDIKYVNTCQKHSLHTIAQYLSLGPVFLSKDQGAEKYIKKSQE